MRFYLYFYYRFTNVFKKAVRVACKYSKFTEMHFRKNNREIELGLFFVCEKINQNDNLYFTDGRQQQRSND